MANLSKKTIRKMREVIAAVKANAKFYDQESYPAPKDCGAVCCAAGFAVWLNVPAKRYADLLKQHFPLSWAYMAEDCLGLPPTGSNLFWTQYCWPDQFTDQYNDATTAKGRAQAMADRWEHFIATDGAE